MHQYQNTLAVTEAEPLLDYVLSWSEARKEANTERIDEVRDHVRHIIEKHGASEITTDSGLFVAYNGS